MLTIIIQWEFEGDNGKFTIKNKGSGNYAYVSSDAGEKTHVKGKSDSCEWKVVGTGTDNQYT